MLDLNLRILKSKKCARENKIKNAREVCCCVHVKYPTNTWDLSIFNSKININYLFDLLVHTCILKNISTAKLLRFWGHQGQVP